MVQKLLIDPFNMTSLNQGTHTGPGLKKRSQISRKQEALFQVRRSLTPRPPSSFGLTTVVQATRAVMCASRFPLHRKALHIEFIFATQAFGSTKEEQKNVVIPAITVFISINLPENDKVFVDQEEKRVLI